MVNFSLVIDGGYLLDDKNKNGVVNLMIDIMMEGIVIKMFEQLEEEIEMLGVSISMYMINEFIVV